VSGDENPMYVYTKQGWKSMHNKYKACPSKCEHTRKKSKNSSSNEVRRPDARRASFVTNQLVMKVH
jgi:hypothetical protein